MCLDYAWLRPCIVIESPRNPSLSGFVAILYVGCPSNHFTLLRRISINAQPSKRSARHRALCIFQWQGRDSAMPPFDTNILPYPYHALRRFHHHRTRQGCIVRRGRRVQRLCASNKQLFHRIAPFTGGITAAKIDFRSSTFSTADQPAMPSFHTRLSRVS